MDAKALAKSKRAHSLHHSKKHHHQKPKPVGPAAAKDAPKQPANQVAGNVQQSKRRNALPSNWDRYDDEDDLDLGNFVRDNLVKTTDVPKSKGADYTYLISEAKSQLSSENFPSLDDDITDFYHGLGPLLSVRGEGILSWIDDDNFDVDDESTANVEASFLSLDLNALSDRLEEMDLCERLFIETDDLLSEELTAQVSEPKGSYKSEQIQHEELAEKSFEPTKENNASRSEAELDILLNSFSETKFLDSTTTPDHTKSYFKLENQKDSTSYSKPTSIIASLDDELDDILKGSSHGMLGKSSNINLPQPNRGTWTSPIGGAKPTSVHDTIDDLLNETSNFATSYSKPTSITASLDDDLDDLLKGTSHGMLGKSSNINLPQPNRGTWTSHTGGAMPTSVNLDDTLDDLLNETSNFANQSQSRWSLKPMSNDSVSMSRLLDDNSFFDTL